MILHPVAAIALVLVALGAIIGGTWWLSRIRRVDAELSRKTVHIGMGLLVLSFPWLFNETWPVVVLAALAIGALLILRIGRLRTKGPGTVLLGVDRSSLGDLYFPISVAVLFTLAKGNWPFYCIPLLVLTLADAFAALLGRRWGRMKYTTAGSHKSYEGSTAFLAVAFACVFLPLVGWGSVHWYSAALVAITVAFIVTALEAISLSGRDNLYIPFAVFVLLKLYLPLTPDELWLRLITLTITLCLVALVRYQTTLDDAALLGATLTGYAAYVIGGWPWLVPPALVLLSYTRIYPNCHSAGRGVHDIHAVVSVTAGGYICLLLFAETGRPGWYLPYAVSYGAQLAMIGVASLAATFPRHNLVTLTAKASILASLALCTLIFSVGYSVGREVSATVYGATVLLCSASAFVFAGLQPMIRDCPVNTARWIRQGLIGIALSLPAFIIVEGEK